MALIKGLKWLLLSSWRLLNFTRNALLNLAFLLLLALVIFASRDNTPATPEISGALTLTLNGPLVEQRSQNASTLELLKQLDDVAEPPRELVLSELVWAIGQAKTDPRIRALVLKPQDLPNTPLPKLQVLAAAIADFKQSQKPVIALADFYSQSQYFLAAHADRVLLNQSGAVLLEGMSVYQPFFKGVLDKLAITPHVFKVGSYKSFVEPYTRSDMSPESKQANRHWLAQLWRQYVDAISTQRQISATQIDPAPDALLNALRAAHGNAATYALNAGLVDALLTRQGMSDEVIAITGKNKRHSWQGVEVLDYLDAIEPPYAHADKPQIGLITASGAIMDGKQPAGVIGGDSLSRLIDKARRDDHIKALVLRIDSPGGSAFAAEQIRQALLALKAADKPFVVSMGSYAASGGYWIAADADKIFAHPSTLTGSIGVFGLFASFDKALARYGINTDGVATTAQAGLSPLRPLPAHVSAGIQLNVEDTYRRFVDLVAKGRQLSLAEAEKAAQGRVWTGLDGKKLGLVDELGNLEDALQAAAQLADLSTWQVTPITPPQSARDKFLREWFGVESDHTSLLDSLSARLSQTLLNQASQYLAPEFRHLLRPLSNAGTPMTNAWQFNDPQHTYLFCSTCR
ncbi:MAG: signal peptide peptidase SppA [Aeromonas sp.]